MKNYLKVIIIITFLICILVISIIYNQNQKEQERINEREKLLMEYEGAAYQLHLQIQTDKYDETSNPNDIVLVPTESTESLLKRWKAVSEIFTEIDYPKTLLVKGIGLMFSIY
ncbi:hypothetical protein SFC15_10685 [Shouchella clausii]